MRFTSGTMLTTSVYKVFVCVTLCNLGTGHAFPRPQNSGSSSTPTETRSRDEWPHGKVSSTDSVKYTLKTQVEICDVFCFNGSKHYLPLRCRGPRLVTCARCSCDVTCAIYGDCCPDKDGVVPPPPTSGLAFSCVGGHGLAFTTGTPYMMIDACPDDTSLPGDLSPVTSTLTNITYVNEASAVCNNDLEVVPWTSELKCGTWGYCDNQFQPAPAYPHHHPCNWQRTMLDQTVIESCNVSGSMPSYSVDLQKLCGSTEYLVWHGVTAYRNIFCYLCNVINEMTFVVDCSEGWGAFLGEDEPEVTCPEDSWADPVYGICREIHCMSGLQLKDAACVIDPVRPYSLYLIMLTFDLAKVPGLETWEEAVRLFKEIVPNNVAPFHPFMYYFTVESLNESSTNIEVHVSVELWSRKGNGSTFLTDAFYGVWHAWSYLYRGQVVSLEPKPYDYYKIGTDTREFMLDPLSKTCCLETDYDTFFDYLYDETDIFEWRDEIHNEFDFNGPPCPYITPTDSEVEVYANGSIGLMAGSVTLGQGDYFTLYENEIQICISTLQAAYNGEYTVGEDRAWNRTYASLKEKTSLSAVFDETLNESLGEKSNNTDAEYSIENKKGNVNMTLNKRDLGYSKDDINDIGTLVSISENPDHSSEKMNFNVSKSRIFPNSEYTNANFQKTTINTDDENSKGNLNLNINETSKFTDHEYSFENEKMHESTMNTMDTEHSKEKNINNDMVQNNSDSANSKKNVNANDIKAHNTTHQNYFKVHVNFNVNKTSSHMRSEYYRENVNLSVHVDWLSNSSDRMHVSSGIGDKQIKNTLKITHPGYFREHVKFNIRKISKTSNTSSEYHREQETFNISKISNNTNSRYHREHDKLNISKISNNINSGYHREHANSNVNNTKPEYPTENVTSYVTSMTSNTSDPNYDSGNININISNNSNNTTTDTSVTHANENVNTSWSTNTKDPEYSNENLNLNIDFNNGTLNLHNHSVNANNNAKVNNTSESTGGKVSLGPDKSMEDKVYPNIENVNEMFNTTMNATEIISDLNTDNIENTTFNNDEPSSTEDDRDNMNKTLHAKGFQTSSKNVHRNDKTALNITGTLHSENGDSNVNISMRIFPEDRNENDNMKLNKTNVHPNGMHENSALNTFHPPGNPEVVFNRTMNDANGEPIDNAHVNDDTTLYVTDTRDRPNGGDHNTTEMSTQYPYYANVIASDKNTTGNRTDNVDIDGNDAEARSGSVEHSIGALIVFTTCAYLIHIICSCLM